MDPHRSVQARPERPETPAAARRGGPSLALAVLCTLLFLTFLDNTIVSVALGSVQTDLHAGVSDLQWVVGAYALVFASVMLACGMIGDEFGRKVVMLSGAGVFCAGSVLCALAPNPGVLIAGRAVMGLGAAASEPGTLSMLRHLYPDQRGRDRAIGVWAAVSGLALALGPVIGGALVGAWNWRALFWFNLVFGLAALILAAVVLPESADPAAHRVDTAGALLGAAVLAALMFAIIDAETAGFAAPLVLALFCVSAVAAAAFGWREARAAHPLIYLKIFRAARFSTANVVAFCTYFATFAVFFFTALYLFEVVGLSGYRIALVFLPMTVLMILASLATGRWLDRIGLRWSIGAGCLLFAAGLWLSDLNLSPHPHYWPLLAALALTGIGIGATVVPITSSALSAVPPERSGMAASATNTSREIGAVTGVAVLGALVNGQLNHSIASQLRGLGLPATIQAVVIKGVETGQVPASNSSGAGPAGQAALVQKVIEAAYTAFHDGLRDALFLSAALVLAAGLLAVVTLRARPTDHRGNG
ncbi:MAG TPA: MFS transporter [Streptosporangiaceae bacterium]|nr:MFS transporter [Streptosporangiaceae bacterium]